MSVIDIDMLFFSGRHQSAVCELDGFMYVIGGAESWNCLNTVERYNPENNTWTLIAPMNVARRGAAVAVHAGKPTAAIGDVNNAISWQPLRCDLSAFYYIVSWEYTSNISLNLSRQTVCRWRLRWLPRAPLRGGLRPSPQRVEDAG